MNNISYIDSQASFEDACQALRNATQLSVDTEFVRRDTYYPILALLQIADAEQTYLIDPLTVADWSALAEIFASDTQIFMHSCSEDLEVFRRSVGVLPANLIDTQIAAAFLGRGDALGYANLVTQTLGHEIDKSETQSDWLRRPLSESQIAYAAADVLWLVEIGNLLLDELTALGRLQWVVDETLALSAKYLEETPVSAAWLRLKGLGKIAAVDWPLAQKICEWREQTARDRNKPKSWIVKDPEIMEVIQSKPRTIGALSQLSNLSPPSVRHHGKALLACVDGAEHLSPPEGGPLPELTGSERKVLKQLQKIVADCAEKESLAQRFLASKQELTHYILYRSQRVTGESSLDSGWRKALLGDALQAVL